MLFKKYQMIQPVGRASPKDVNQTNYGWMKAANCTIALLENG